jgi:hypothetical protein
MSSFGLCLEFLKFLVEELTELIEYPLWIKKSLYLTV